MKFYRTYTYQVYDIKDTFSIILFCLLGLGFSYTLFSMVDLNFRLFGFVILILVVIAFFGCSPYGRGSICLDRQALRVVPMNIFFKYLLPRVREYSLNRELSIEINLSIEIMIIRQDQQRRIVKLNGLSKNSKRKLTNLLKILAKNRHNITLELNRVLLDDESLKLDPGEVKDYPYLLETGDKISLNIWAGSSNKFDIQLFSKLNFLEMKNPEPYFFTSPKNKDSSKIQWIISNSGSYRMVVRNKSQRNIHQIRFNLIQNNRFGEFPPETGV